MSDCDRCGLDLFTECSCGISELEIRLTSLEAENKSIKKCLDKILVLLDENKTGKSE